MLPWFLSVLGVVVLIFSVYKLPLVSSNLTLTTAGSSRDITLITCLAAGAMTGASLKGNNCLVERRIL